ncbi:helix-turn-helix transcriptional regulator [Galbitalea soli]|uniref:PadR family transcriptional regulator n=1 Tax=Galbitalea soli TaxID=1268042 RepID=A0A7C9TQ39_9MICO|nr:PadR family transcriptional regulator [Galbitalea soli]NYJ31213.1 DNA-binding PadR family transcriptional regulator [Galbitalea soli]
MSSIRLYLLDALAERGPMHGHQLRLLAEEEHVHVWTDISVGAVYGALKRMLADGLIRETRSERAGSYPQRQVYEITEQGIAALREMRAAALGAVVIRTDPFDLAMTRLDRDRLDDLPTVIAERIRTLEHMLDDAHAMLDRAAPYLTVGEAFVMTHKVARIRADIAWHHELLTELPAIIADESARKDPS